MVEREAFAGLFLELCVGRRGCDALKSLPGRRLFAEMVVRHREVELEQLDEPENDAVYEALEFECEGLITCDAVGRWTFICPLSVRCSNAPPE